MRYAIVRPKRREIEVVDSAFVQDVYEHAGLDPHDVDHGSVGHGVGVVVDGEGLFKTPHPNGYVGICGQLFAGNTVLYAFDERGETIDLDPDRIGLLSYYTSVEDAEAGIARGEITRPIMAVNDVVFWRWPEEQK